MRIFSRKFAFVAVLAAIVLLSSATAFANNPGGHMFLLTWNADASCVAPTCGVNVYLGTSPGVCGKGKLPVATMVAGTSYENDSVVPGTIYWAATEMLLNGGEGPCSAEGQNTVQNSQAGNVSGLQVQAH